MARYTIELISGINSTWFRETRTAKACHLVLHDVADWIFRNDDLCNQAMRRRFDALELKVPKGPGFYGYWVVKIADIGEVVIHVYRGK